MDSYVATEQPSTSAPLSRKPRRELAQLLLWAAFVAIWVVPQFKPRGLYFGGRYSLADFYFGVPIGCACIGSLLVRLLPRRMRRPAAVRLTALCMAVMIGVLAVDSLAAAWRMGHWDYWFDFHKVIRNGNRDDAELGWVRKPNLVWKTTNHSSGKPMLYTTDENGFRNPKGMSSADVVCIGDSFTEGVELDAAETYSGLLAARTRLRVANCGRSGYGPPQELVVVKKYALRYKPKVIVWQIYEGNDINDAEHYSAWITDRKKAEAEAKPSNPIAGYIRFSPLIWQLSKTWPEKFGRPTIRYANGETGVFRWYGPDFYIPDVRTEHAAAMKVIEESISEGYRICKEAGIKLVVLYIPLRNRVYAPYLVYNEPGGLAKFLPGGPDGHENDLDATLRRHCAAIGCPFIDMYPVYKAQAAKDLSKLYFVDDIHLDTVGHQLAASEISQWLSDHLQTGSR